MPDIIEITDFSDPRLDIYARLREVQLLHYNEPKPGLFIAESLRVIERALDAGCVPVSLLLEQKHVEGQARQLIGRCDTVFRKASERTEKGVPVFTADLTVLSKLTGFPLTRGALCAMYRPPMPDPAQICSSARRIAVLENITNPTNVGAIFRSAAALCIDAVLLTPACSDPLYRRTIRVSMGTVFQIPWTFLDGDSVKWPEQGMEFLHSLGFKSVAMALQEDSLSIEDPRLASEEKLAIVLGSEGDGLCAATITNCDYTVRIPMARGVDSLNVAAASAVAFWQLRVR